MLPGVILSDTQRTWLRMGEVGPGLGSIDSRLGSRLGILCAKIQLQKGP